MQTNAEHMKKCVVSETQSCIFIESHKFHNSMTLSCGSGKGRALIAIEGDIFFMSLYQIIPIFNKKITRKSFRNDFGNFCVNFLTEFEFQVSRQAEFSFHKLLIITHEISHHFCIDSRWNRQNRPILTLLKSRLTCLRFYDAPISAIWRQRIIRKTR